MDVRHGHAAEKGLKLRIIHNIDRSLSEMMLGLESFIPMYMTGQIEPYYFKIRRTVCSCTLCARRERWR